MDLVGVEGHWTLIEHTMFKCFKISDFDGVAKSCIYAFRQVLWHQRALLASPAQGPVGRGHIP